MDTTAFRTYLEGQNLSENGIASRLSKINRIESILGHSMDYIVSDDARMYQALEELQLHEDPKHNPMQNVLRKYYSFKNSKEFPRKRSFNY